MKLGSAHGLRKLDVAVALLSIAVSAAVALAGLAGEVWYDEFWTLALVEPGTSPFDLLQKLRNDAHPYLYFWLIWLAQAVGVQDIAGLRAVNILAIALVAAPVYAAVRGGDLTWRAALMILVLAVGSRIFARYLPELRPYLLTYGAAVGFSVVWAAYARRAIAGLAIPGYLVWLWAITLGVLCNLQHFGWMLGGALTIVLLAIFSRQGLVRQMLVISVVSAAAACPALLMFAVQAQSSIAGDMTWVTTTPLESVRILARVMGHAGLANLGALLAAFVAAALAVRARGRGMDLAPIVGLLTGVGLFLAVILVRNLLVPWIIDRYLLAAAGAVTVALAMLATDEAAFRTRPRLMRGLFLLACGAAPALLVGLLLTGKLTRAGWSSSTEAVVAAVQACPSTRLYSGVQYSSLPVSPAYGALTLHAKRYGHAYYLRRAGLAATELAPDEVVRPGIGCPAVVWIEQVHDRKSVPPFVRSLRMPKEAKVEVRYVGSGALIFVEAPAAR